MDQPRIINIFLNKPVPENIAALFLGVFPGTTPITLTSRDAPYLHYAAFLGTPSESVDMIRLPTRISTDVAEISFLDTLGLIAVQGDTTYISPLAEALYGATGPFQVDTADMTPDGRRRVFAPTAGLFSKYVIPGYVARANQYHALLPDTIGLATDMDRAQLALAAISARLDDIVNAGGMVGKPESRVGTAARSAASAVRDFIRPPPPTIPVVAAIQTRMPE